jgi:hypothetical protein
MCADTVTPPTFFARRDYPSAGGFPSVGDVNGDGIPDIVAVGLSETVSVLLGNGNGTFRSAIDAGPSWENMTGGVLLDLNGDGKLDLVIAGGPNGHRAPCGIGVCFGNGDGTFQLPVLYQAGSDIFANNPVVGDFNGDGIPDVVEAGSSGVWLFTGKGGGVFNPGVVYSSQPELFPVGRCQCGFQRRRKTLTW